MARKASGSMVAAIPFNYDRNPKTVEARRAGTLGQDGNPSEDDADYKRIEAGHTVDLADLPAGESDYLIDRLILVTAEEWEEAKKTGRRIATTATAAVRLARAKIDNDGGSLLDALAALVDAGVVTVRIRETVPVTGPVLADNPPVELGRSRGETRPVLPPEPGEPEGDVVSGAAHLTRTEDSDG